MSDAGVELDHGHPHDHEPHPQAATEQFASSAANHSHLSLWGFDFTLPSPNEQSGGNDPPEPLVLLGESKLATHVVFGQLGPDDVLLLLQDVAGDVCYAEGDTVTPLRRPQVDTPILCDRARFERTGVLRI
ncbi:hypothetical protein [Botrimarina sp.]|uniref:hypothetical protein n=1 Tax=Botrimarina sp. TaxID=2795802 RepID=UPI0032EB2F9A